MSAERLTGGCHCGGIRFTAMVDLSAETVLDCTCSICRKKGFLHLIVSADRFELLQGEPLLATYRFGTHTARHHFCRTCGIAPFYRPRSHPEAFDINVRCLDEDVTDRVQVETFDGLDWEDSVQDRWGSP